MNLYVDTTARALVIAPTATTRCLMPGMTVGDKVPLTINFLTRNQQPLNTGLPIYNYADFSAAGIVFALGAQAAPPTAGSFILTFGANATPPLAFNVSQYALSLALNSLASIISSGGVTVSGNIGGQYFIRFITPGAQSAITVSTNALTPASSATVATDQVGTSALPALQVLTLLQTPVSQVISWTPQASPVITVTAINGTITQRISIPAGTYGGSFTLTTNGNTTVAMPFAAQLDLVQNAMNALPGVTGCTVSPGQNYWDITIPSWGHAITGSAAGLQCPLNLTGDLDLTPPSVQDLLGGELSADVPFYIQAASSTPNPQTILSGTVNLSLL